MIQPTEETPGQFGHSAWKLNVFGGLIVCVVGIAMMISVALFIYGAIVLGAGLAWAVIAAIVGMRQERIAPAPDQQRLSQT